MAPPRCAGKKPANWKSIVEQFLKADLRPNIVPNHKVRDGIAAVRRLFPQMYIDEGATGDLLEAMKAYRRQWNDNLLIFSDVPLHDWASDYCDALRYVAVAAGVMGFAPKSKELTGSRELPSEFNLANLFEDNEARRMGIRRIT